MIEEITKSISVKVSEDIDNLIITTICDWYERDTEIRISKRDLKRAISMYYGDMSDIKDVANMVETRLVNVGQSDARFKLGETIRYSPSEVKHILFGDYKPKQYEQEETK